MSLFVLFIAKSSSDDGLDVNSHLEIYQTFNAAKEAMTKIINSHSKKGWHCQTDEDSAICIKNHDEYAFDQIKLSIYNIDDLSQCALIRDGWTSDAGILPFADVFFFKDQQDAVHFLKENAEATRQAFERNKQEVEYGLEDHYAYCEDQGFFNAVYWHMVPIV